MTMYICKCGRKFKKSGNSDTTGYRIADYGEANECYGCPYALAVKDGHLDATKKRYEYTIRAWECRASQRLRYDTYARLSLNSKNAGSIYSLDLPFLLLVQEAIKEIDGITGDRDRPGERGPQYGSDGLYRFPVYPEQNKKGIAGKQKLFDLFFSADGVRKNVTPEDEKLIVLKQIEEATMGKMNLANINSGLNKVKAITESLANVARFEMIPTDSIELADYNPFSDNDSDESRYSLAMSIQASGLIEPLAVNKKSSEKYKLISGEHRFTAIQQYLHWKTVPCMVFEGITDDEAQLKLYEANTYREYTSEQKFERYQELEKLLRRMKDSGKFSGGIQKAIADRLGVTDRQVRKYKAIDETLTDEVKQAVKSGKVSVNDAYKMARPEPVKTGISSDLDLTEVAQTAEPIESIETPKEEKSGTSSGFEDNEAEEEWNQPEQSDESFWQDKIKFALKRHYDVHDIYLYYLFEVPTTQDAIRDKLKPRYGGGGGTVFFSNGEHGFCTLQTTKLELSYKTKRTEITYTQVDSYIRDMIRNDEWLIKAEAKSVIKKFIGQ